MENIKWGIIGCGDVTEVKSGPAFQQCEGSELIAVMRRTSEKAKDFARRHQVPKWYDDADDLIHDPEINAVYVATPPDSHAFYTIKALEAGKPVYCEKPMAKNHEECNRMLESSQQNNLPLFVAYYRRSLSNFLKTKELIDTKRIGAVRSVNLRLQMSPKPDDYNTTHLPWRVVPKISGGGHFVDLGAHQLDILDYFFGPVSDVRGIAHNQAGLYPAEDAVSAGFRFDNGVIGSGDWSFTVHEKAEEDVIEIKGTKGKIILSCFDHAHVTLLSEEEEQTFAYDKPVHIQQNMIQAVVDELQNKGTSPSHGESAARTNWVMDQILQSYYNT